MRTGRTGRTAGACETDDAERSGWTMSVVRGASFARVIEARHIFPGLEFGEEGGVYSV